MGGSRCTIELAICYSQENNMMDFRNGSLTLNPTDGRHMT